MNAITPDMTARLNAIGKDVAGGRLVPFLGPGVLGDAEGCPVPVSPRGLAAVLASQVGIPGRIRNNMWSAAQYIETKRHRQTLEKMMAAMFATTPEPGPVHRWLASLETAPLIVDTWYDGTMARALEEAGRRDWGQVQGITRNGEWREIWWKAFQRDGVECADEATGDWTTILYKPHGSSVPVNNVLISDSDYVEVLTEIDIQTPIPPMVKDLRTERGFLFLGCRFYDQMLRTFARQIIKRSKGPHFAVLPPQTEDANMLTRMEQKFLIEAGITPLFVALDEAVPGLSGATPASS